MLFTRTKSGRVGFSRKAAAVALVLGLCGCDSKGAEASNVLAAAATSEPTDDRIYIRCIEHGRSQFLLGKSIKLGPAQDEDQLFRIDLDHRRVDVWLASDSVFEDRCNLSPTDDNSCTLEADDKLIRFVVRPRARASGRFEMETLAFDRLTGAYKHVRSNVTFEGDQQSGFVWNGAGHCNKVAPPLAATRKF